MSNDRSNLFFNVLALENILVALNREIGDGPCFLYINFSLIGVILVAICLESFAVICFFTFGQGCVFDYNCKICPILIGLTGVQ